jgi:hypothetical protein
MDKQIHVQQFHQMMYHLEIEELNLLEMVTNLVKEEIHVFLQMNEPDNQIYLQKKFKNNILYI